MVLHFSGHPQRCGHAPLLLLFSKNVKTSAEIYSYFSALGSHQDPEVQNPIFYFLFLDQTL